MENNNSFSFSYLELNSNEKNNYDKKLNETSEINYIKDIEEEDIFICLLCNRSPKINFITRETIDLNCKCINIKNFPIKKIDKYLINYKNNKIKINFIICKTHKKPLFYYCLDCKFDICRKCRTKMIAHLGHSLKILPKYDINFQNIKNYINSNTIEEDSYLNKLLKSMLYTYTIYPNSNLYDSIKNANEFLENEKYNENIHVNLDEIIEIKIRISKQLENNRNNATKIIEINIEEKNFYDLNELCGLDLFNLKILKLEENNISDISPLFNENTKFNDLEILVLSRNHINDKNMEYFFQLHKKFPKLIQFNISLNSLHNRIFFNAMELLKNLKILDTNSNRFYEKKEEENLIEYKKELNFDSLEELYLSRGCFSDTTIDLFSNYQLKKLKILDLSGNNLSGLDLMQYIQSENLEEIYLRNNRIKKLSIDREYKGLKIIYLENNIIDNIDNLNEFIQKFPDLKKIEILKNKFLFTEKNNKIISDIQKSKTFIEIL